MRQLGRFDALEGKGWGGGGGGGGDILQTINY